MKRIQLYKRKKLVGETVPSLCHTINWITVGGKKLKIKKIQRKDRKKCVANEKMYSINVRKENLSCI